MKISESKAKELFLKKFPDGIGIDFAGRSMLYEEYNLDTEEGWNIDHILPESKGGGSNEGNLQCTNIQTNRIKADKTTWIDDNREYQVRKIKNKAKSYKVVCLRDVYLIEKLPSDIINSDELKAKRLFLKKFPSGVGYDFVGRKIRIQDYKKRDSAYGWALGFILSNVYGGKNVDSNIEIYNYASLMLKGDKQSWEDGGSYWQVRKSNGKYSIVELCYINGKTFLKDEVK